MRARPGDLLVPVALDASGAWRPPDEAPDGGAYRCPEWGARAVVREGAGVRRHFAHFRRPARCRLAGESGLHLAAKYAVLAAVKRWRQGRAPAPCVVASCAACGGTVEERPLRDRVGDAAPEVPTPDRASRLDVALLAGNGRILLGVEVRHRHPVDGEKAVALRRAGVPWIEVAARQALEGEGARLAEAARRARALAAPRNRFERSLAERRTWTPRQREALGRFYPKERLLEIVRSLREAHSDVPLFEGFASRMALFGGLPRADAARALWHARFGVGPRAASRPR